MDKIIVITGGSDGLGRTIARKLNDENKVIILSNNQKMLKEVSNNINCEHYVCDVTDWKQVEDTVNKIIQKHDHINILINNAGVWLA